MPEQQNEKEQQSGIFEPKPMQQIKPPVSGVKQANRLMLAIGVIILAVILFVFFSGRYLSPVRKYYKGLSKSDPAAMTDAFPSWLVNADAAEGQMTIDAMCAAMISSTNLAYGTDCKAKASLQRKEPVDAAKCEQLTSGIASRYHVNVKVRKGWICTLNVQYTSPDGSDINATEYVTLYQIGGRWCMLDVPNPKK